MDSEMTVREAAAAQVPTFDELIWPTLEALRSLGGSASNEELLSKVIEVTGVSDEVASIVHSDHRQTKLSYNLAWAKTYLKRVGVPVAYGRSQTRVNA